MNELMPSQNIKFISLVNNINQMGNTACCENPIEVQNKHEVIVPTIEEKPNKSEHNDIDAKQHTTDSVIMPEITEAVKQNLHKHRPFQDKLNGDLKLKKFDSLIYQGEVNDKGNPHGYGKMYYPNGSVYVGSFQQGVASGQGHFVFSDGSYYTGKMKNNKANDNSGIFQAEGSKYVGSIKNNQIDGFGKQQGEDYSYQGHFENGKIKLGKLSWSQRQTRKLPLSQEQVTQIADWYYEGSFDSEGNFDGKGILKGTKGKYTGDFRKGLKHGKGSFQYFNKLKYDGTYVNDIKNGQGTLFSTDGKVAYCGQFVNGLPHGRGWIPLPDGSKNYLEFKEGISCLLSQKD